MKPEPELNNRIAALPPDKRAALMKRLQESGGASGSHRIPRRDPLLPPPLSFAQERLWFLAALEPESPAYNSAKAYNLNGPLNVEALQKTLDEIVRRHEAPHDVCVPGRQPDSGYRAAEPVELGDC